MRHLIAILLISLLPTVLLNARCTEEEKSVEMKEIRISLWTQVCDRSGNRVERKAAVLVQGHRVAEGELRWSRSRQRYIATFVLPEFGSTQLRVRFYYNPCNGAVSYKGYWRIPAINGDWTSIGHSSHMGYLESSSYDCSTGSSATPVYRYLSNDGRHFWTSCPDHEDLAGYRREGVAFYAARGGVAVHRFRHKTTGKHFWTASDEERRSLRGFEYEGIAFFAPTNGYPVYRFYNRSTGKHFWTAKKDHEDLRGYVEEGVAFYCTKKP